MKMYLLLVVIFSGAFLAGISTIGIALAGDRNVRAEVAVFGYQGLVVMWLGVVASLVYLYSNRNR